MIHSILSESLSPTLSTERLTFPKFDTKTIEGTIMDDDGKEFGVKITYDFYPYQGWEPEVVVSSFDFEVNGTPNISEKDLWQEVKDLIRQEERCFVHYQ